MVDFGYLYRGLCGLARAHQVGPMAGHLGAAVVAGYFFGEDHAELDRRVHQGVEKELDRILAGDEAIWYDVKKSGIAVADLFRPFAEQTPRKERIASIAEALAGNIDQTRQSGHNVIFASIALRALHDHPRYALPSIVDGIRKLIERFDGAVPGRGYYGKGRGWIRGDKVELAADNQVDAYHSLEAMAATVADELVRTAALRRQGFGGLWHLINHAAGLAELAQYGYRELAHRGLDAHWNHVRLWRSLPDVRDELGPVGKAKHDPRTAEYWTTGTLRRDSARLTHRVKTLYGFFTLTRLVGDASQRHRAEDALRYLMD